MISISLCMIVKNEQETLARCLESVKAAVDEIIIVDTGSTDATKQIAAQYTDKVYDFPWIDDFSAARNYSYSLATKDYIMWLDADDILEPDQRDNIVTLKNTLDPRVDIVMMKYIAATDAQGRPSFWYYRERLSRRSGNYKWFEPVHEYLALAGNIINADISIKHAKMHPAVPGRNLSIYEKILQSNGALSPRGLYYFARELKDNEQYQRAIDHYCIFLDTRRGWVEDNIGACVDIAKCYTVLGERENALFALLRSFQFAAPRAEACCRIGYHFKDAGDYNTAIFWFTLAEQLDKPDNTWSFVENDYLGYIPCVELCVCYDKLGKRDMAVLYNERAAQYKPDDPAVLYNREYFLKTVG